MADPGMGRPDGGLALDSPALGAVRGRLRQTAAGPGGRPRPRGAEAPPAAARGAPRAVLAGPRGSDYT